jgi:adenylate cyclase
MGEKILSLAERLDDASMRVEGNLVLGANLAFLKNVNLGLEHLEKAMAGYDPDRPRTRGFPLGNNPGVVGLSVSALLLWMQGFPDRALERANASIALATRLNHPYSRAYALFHASYLHLGRRECEPVQERAQAVLDIAEEHEFLTWKAVATCLHGAALAGMGRAEEGVAQVRQGIHLYQGLNTPPVFLSLLLYIQAEAYGQVGQPGQGIVMLDQALEHFGLDSEDLLTAEFYRLKGELLLALSPDHALEAENWFQRALKAAQKRELPIFELRAGMSLCRLWQDQGKADQGRQLLSEAYARFTEGFTTADLLEAKDLLSR